MKFTPPHIERFGDIGPAIVGRDEFIIVEKPDHIAVDYVYIDPETFDPDNRHFAHRLECRGIKFGLDGRIIARPFHKFFNVNERADTAAHLLDMDHPHIVLTKMDGSMVHTAMLGNEVVLMTRKGRTDIAKRAEELLTDKIVNTVRDVQGSITFIFEYVAPDNRIIIQYDKPELYLIGARFKSTGRYINPLHLYRWARTLGVKYPDIRTLFDKYDGDTLVSDIRDNTGTEGVVVQFQGGAMVKIKTDEYVLMHKAKELMSREKDIIALILEGKLDDLLPLVDESNREALMEYQGKVMSFIHGLYKRAGYIVNAAENLDQKYFATKYLPASILGQSKRLMNLGFSMRAGHDLPVEKMLSRMKVKEIRNEFHSWPDYPDFDFGDAEEAAAFKAALTEEDESNEGI